MFIEALVKKLYKIRDMEENVKTKNVTVYEDRDSHDLIDHLVFLRDNAEASDLKSRIQAKIDEVCEYMLEEEMDKEYVHSWEDCND